MLAADKLQLQSQLRQQAVSLKEKEFNLHHSNLMTVGTQAAVLAGLDITMFIEFTPAPVSEWKFAMVPRVLSFVYYTMISAAFCSNMMVVSQTTALSVLGAGLALRGPDGSMMVATDALYGLVHLGGCVAHVELGNGAHVLDGGPIHVPRHLLQLFTSGDDIGL
jgi:hypothetical protein